MATVITNLLSAIPVFGQDIVELIWGGFSVNNATLNRFFSLHYILPFVLAALVVGHLIAVHIHGSNNPNGVTGHADRVGFYPYFVFKDLVTIFAFLLVLSIIVFFYPNLLGQLWPYIIFMFIKIILNCAISWKYIFNLKFYNKILLLQKIYNKTIFVSDSNLIIVIRNIIILLFNPSMVKYYYKVYYQLITNVNLNFLLI